MATRWRREAALASRVVVATPEKAAAQAGASRVPLPALSSVLGPEVQLTLSLDRRTVLWAVEEGTGCWAVTHVSPATVITRVPKSALGGPCLPETHHLVRAALPAEPEAATRRIQQLLEERDSE